MEAIMKHYALPPDLVAGFGHGHLRDRALLESALARPVVTVGGEYAYQTVFSRAAVLLRGIAENHPFVDGNKRSAWHATRVYLAVHGWQVTAPTWDVVTFIEDTVTWQLSHAEMSYWLRDHAERANTAPGR